MRDANSPRDLPQIDSAPDTSEEDKRHPFVPGGKFGTREGRECLCCGEGIFDDRHTPPKGGWFK